MKVIELYQVFFFQGAKSPMRISIETHQFLQNTMFFSNISNTNLSLQKTFGFISLSSVCLWNTQTIAFFKSSTNTCFFLLSFTFLFFSIFSTRFIASYVRQCFYFSVCVFYDGEKLLLQNIFV